MDIRIIEPPAIAKPLTYSYKISQKSKEEYERKTKRANEIGIHLFVLDEEDLPTEIIELEQYIIDNYLNMDLDVPDDIKQKYMDLKQKLSDKQ